MVSLNRSSSAASLRLVATTLALVSCVVAMPVRAAVSNAQRCEVGKIKVAGKLTKCKAGVYSKSISKNAPVDSARVTRCSSKYAAGFAKAEEQGGAECPTLGDLHVVEGIVEDCIDDAVTDLGGAPGVAGDGQKCQSKKVKAVGKYLDCRFKAQAKAVAKSTEADFLKCETKFTAAFEKLELKVPCDTQSDAGALQAELDGCSDIVQSGLADVLATFTTSPAGGETGAALTRETIITFSVPLDPGVVVTTDDVFSTFGGEMLQARIHTSPDRRKVTLFYDSPLPASSRIRVTVVGDSLLDALGRPVDADGDRTVGGVGVFDFDTLTLTSILGTSIFGRIFASELTDDVDGMAVNTPLEGVTVTVDGADDTYSAVTDEMGNFTLDPAPAGRFFVHIDGTTSTNGGPDGAYYPRVGKAWESLPGETSSVGDVFLPLIAADTLQTVSADVSTLIGFPQTVLDANPQLENVAVIVPADSLYGDDGSRGGMVGIAPVPPDRLPGTLPEELEFPLVITVQTDGATNFDEPAPICFPNLPLVDTDVTLGPGEKSALWSFNHDSGEWQIRGPMTVSPDGTLVCSDAGFGIVAPGWHGTDPGCDGRGRGRQRDCGACCRGASRTSGCCDSGTQVGNGIFCIGGIIATVGAVGAFAYGCAPSAIATGGATAVLCAEAAYSFIFGIGSSAFGCSSFLDCLGSRGARSLVFGDRSLDVVVSDGLAFLELTETAATQVRDVIGNIDASVELTTEQIDMIASILQEWNNGAGGDAVAKAEALAIELAGLIDEDVALEPMVIDHPIPYVAVRNGGIVLRGTTGTDGRFSLNVGHRTGGLGTGAALEQEWINVTLFDPVNWQFGVTSAPVPSSIGGTFNFSDYFLNDATGLPDADVDGLPDLAEGVFGTGVYDPDSDSDGVLDGTEVFNGTDPLNGILVQTGLIASVDLPGETRAICAGEKFVAVGNTDGIVSVFNTFRGMDPRIVGQLDVGEDVVSLVCNESDLLVLTSTRLIFFNMGDAPAAAIRLTAPLPSTGASVVAGGARAFVGMTSGDVLMLDSTTGANLSGIFLPQAVQDLSVAGDFVYALTQSGIHTLSMSRNSLALGSFTPLTLLGPGVVQRRLRVFAGNGTLWVTDRNGYSTLDIADPATPVLLADGATAQFGWKMLIPDSENRRGVAAVGLSSGSDGPHDIYVYDISDPLNTDIPITTFETPAIAASVVIHEGLAYVAGGASGLHVINYNPADTSGVVPTIALETNIVGGSVIEGSPVRVTAVADDNVQVSRVEFSVDGEVIYRDGSFPFETRFFAPTLSEAATFTIVATAMDTGGNATTSLPLAVSLTPDPGIGPIPYSEVSDSPFAPEITAGTVIVEDFEDGLLNVLGVTADAGLVLGPPSSGIDSVDEDDGLIDGMSGGGHSYWSGFPAPSDGVTFTFDEGVLGSLPTLVGLVHTDDDPNVAGGTTIEFRDRNGMLLSGFVGLLDPDASGFTVNDKFVGVSYPDGVGSIHISASGAAFEVDHLQYTVP